MLVTWRYRQRNSLVQSFDPRAWIIFFGCFLASTLFFWDLRYLSFFFVIALTAVFTSGVTWKESRRAWLFILAFVTFFSILTFLTGRGGMELYTTEHIINRLPAVVCQELCKLPGASVSLAGTVIFRSLSERMTA